MTMNQNNSSNLANIKLIGNIHGNEVVGKEMLLHLLEVILILATRILIILIITNKLFVVHC